MEDKGFSLVAITFPLNHAPISFFIVFYTNWRLFSGENWLFITGGKWLFYPVVNNTSDLSAGKYKKDDNVILEKDAYGNRKVSFAPTKAKDTPIKTLLQLYICATRSWISVLLCLIM